MCLDVNVITNLFSKEHRPHFTGSRLEQALGIKLTRVAYRGSAPIINDLVGGHMPFAISTLTGLTASAS